MKFRNDLTAEQVRAILAYDPEIRLFSRLTGPNAGLPVGCYRKSTNDFVIRINEANYLVHRLAWLWVTGSWPDPECDHKDLDRSNNRWSNLRSATRAQQMANRKVLPTSETQFKGVERRNKRYRAYINVDRKRVRLGNFDSVEEASAAYERAASALHGEFARAA